MKEQLISFACWIMGYREIRYQITFYYHPFECYVTIERPVFPKGYAVHKYKCSAKSALRLRELAKHYRKIQGYY